MSRRFYPLSAAGALILAFGLFPAPARAQYPVHPSHRGLFSGQGQVCPNCGQVHGGAPMPFWRRWTQQAATGAGGGGGIQNPYVGPNRLPRGQVYFNGRYFGDFNNRFFGPQYGYF